METTEEILLIEDLDMFGRGIAHFKNNTIFVEDALVGEVVRCDLIPMKKNLYFAKPKEYLAISLSRVNPKCKYFFSCGGCDLQHLNYLNTLEFKKRQLILSLKKIGNITVNELDLNIIESDNRYFYRNKISLMIKEKDGCSKLCMAKKQSHDSVEISSCKIANEKFDIVIQKVNEFLEENHIKAYNEFTKRGYAKHTVGRIINNSLLLTIVLTQKKNLKLNLLFEKLSPYFEKVGINLNINNSDSEILSKTFCNSIGAKELTFKLFGIEQTITNASFLQVNFTVQQKLYKTVLKNCSGIIVNAYSGAGLLTGLIAKYQEDKIEEFKEKAVIRKDKFLKDIKQNNMVFGIEINPSAHELANILFKRNKIKNAKNFCGDAGEILSNLNIKNYTLVIDPPRKGIDEKMLQTIKKNLPDKIIYISCEPKTLSRDLKNLLSCYTITKIEGFDMFPQTKNLETLVVLKKIPTK